MKIIKACLQKHSIYFLSLMAIFLLSVSLNVFFPTQSLGILHRIDHPAWLNILLINYTFMGDGLFFIGLVLMIAFYWHRKKLAIEMFVAGAITELFVLAIKYVFTGELVFEKGQYLFFDEETGFSNIYSIISGHTALAFTITTILATNLKTKKWVSPLISGACILGFSRIYLAQHSLGEVLAGAVLGTMAALLSLSLLKMRFPKNIYKGSWPKKSLEKMMQQSDLQPV